MIVQGRQQKSQVTPSGHGHSIHPVLGPAGLSIEVVELLLEGMTASTGFATVDEAITVERI